MYGSAKTVHKLGGCSIQKKLRETKYKNASAPRKTDPTTTFKLMDPVLSASLATYGTRTQESALKILAMDLVANTS